MSLNFVAASLRLMGLAGRFLLLLLIGRLMSVDDMGSYGLFAATAAIVVQFVGLELHQPAVREILRRSPDMREPIVRAQLRVYAIAYMALPLVVVAACALDIVRPAHSVMLVLVIVGSHLSLESQRLLIAAGRSEVGFLVLSVAQGLWVFPLAVTFAYWPGLRTLDAIFTTWAAAALLATALGYVGLRRAGLLSSATAIATDSAFFRSAWPSAQIFILSSLLFLLIESVDRYSLSHARGLAAVGVYTLYVGIARAVREVAFAAVVSRWMPRLVRAAHRQDSTEARAVARAMWTRLLAFLAFTIPSLCLVLWLAFPVLNDARYREHATVFGILLASSCVSTMTFVPHYELYAAGRERAIMQTHLVGLIAIVIALAVLVPSFGIDGAAWATLGTAVLLLSLKWSVARRPGPARTS